MKCKMAGLTILVAVTATIFVADQAQAVTKDPCPTADACPITTTGSTTLYKSDGTKVGTTTIRQRTGRDLTYDGGKASAAGCRSLVLHVVQRSTIFNDIIYSIHYQIYWCWYLATVYNYHKPVWYYHEASPAWKAHGIVSSRDTYYPFRGFPRGGYLSIRMWEFEFCGGLATISGCKTNHPEIGSRAHADGTYHFHTEDH